MTEASKVQEGVQDTQEKTFGESLAELERIVSQLEGGQLELEDSLKRYEEGVVLIRALHSKLADAEQKVTVLLGELAPDTE